MPNGHAQRRSAYDAARDSDIPASLNSSMRSTRVRANKKRVFEFRTGLSEIDLEFFISGNI